MQDVNRPRDHDERLWLSTVAGPSVTPGFNKKNVLTCSFIVPEVVNYSVDTVTNGYNLRKKHV